MQKNFKGLSSKVTLHSQCELANGLVGFYLGILDLSRFETVHETWSEHIVRDPSSE